MRFPAPRLHLHAPMKNLGFILISILFISCSHSSINIFSKKRTPYESYVKKLEDTGMATTPEGMEWFRASELALSQPSSVKLPYKQSANFAANKSKALGLKFAATRGQRITFNLRNSADTGFVVYAELFKAVDSTHELIYSADTSDTLFTYDIEEKGNYILRLQPELNRSGKLNIAATAGPSLGFPVAGSKAKIGSVWGDDRDGGKRSHEGVDIFAPKLTPAIAAADGIITGVKDGGIGGKTVWMRPENKNITLYYAHLDKQLVQAGEYVKKGDTLGLVGNTGNAKYTPAHLHFGIYTWGGAIDPYPYINR